MKWNRIHSIMAVMLGLAGALFLYLNSITPFLSDDWHFQFIWTNFTPVDNPQKAQTIQDILTGVRNYYQASGGRAVCHFVTFLMILAGKPVFNILNTGMYLCFLWVLYQLTWTQMQMFGKPKEEQKPLVLGSIIVLPYLFPAFGDGFLWLSGATNYLWSCTLMLSVLYWIRIRFAKAKPLEWIAMLIPTALSAATNEITGAVLFGFLTIRLLCAKEKLWLRSVLMMLSLLPGILLVVLAPGNTIRTWIVQEGDWYYYGSLMGYTSFFVMYYGILTAFVIIAMAVMRRKEIPFLKILSRYALFICGTGSIFALTLAGTVIKRPMIFGGVLILPCAVTSFWYLTRKKLTNKVYAVCLIMITFLIGLETIQYQKWSGYLNETQEALKNVVSIQESEEIVSELYQKEHRLQLFTEIVPAEGRKFIDYTTAWIIANENYENPEIMQNLAEEIRNRDNVSVYQQYVSLF